MQYKVRCKTQNWDVIKEYYKSKFLAVKFKYDSLSLSDIYKNYIQPFEEGWKLYGSQPPASVKSEARNEKHTSLYDINNRKSDKSEKGVSGDAFHQYCMASWDGLPVCILCGFDIDLANKSTIRFCKGCSGYAHVTCIPNPSDDWKCPFCSRTDDPYLNVSYAIRDKQLNVLSPYCEQFVYE